MIRNPLPIDEVLPRLVAVLRESTSAVLRAPTGAGKTTRVPPAILSAGLAGVGQIVVLQPRRLAARATARRMALERGTRLGDEIGYQVRFERQAGPKTRILVATEGILLRQLQDDPFLQHASVVIFDEFHERNLGSELALGMIRQVLETVRPELRVVVMSATLAAEPISAYFGGCPIVESAGRLHPVEIAYAPPVGRQSTAESAAIGVAHALDRTTGDVLVFLPGLYEIRQTARQLAALARERDLAVLELYGDLPAEQQDAVLARCERRKVVLATNVAETSVTIEGITAVVDSGLARILKFDSRVGLDKLELTPISRASADQRAGRAGRTAPGVCLRLWSEASQRIRPEFETPEIKRLDLSGPLLALRAWIEPNVARFPWFELPAPAVLEQAESLLHRLGAIENGQITALGRKMSRLPIAPRLARLLLAGQAFGEPNRAALVAALLSERDPFTRVRDVPYAARGAKHSSTSDVHDRLTTLEEYEHGGAGRDIINRAAAQFIFRARDQLLRLLPREESPKTPSVDSDEAVLRALLVAFPDRLARRREAGSRRGVLVGGRGVKLAPESAVGDSELFLCIDVDGAAPEALVRQASAVQREWLPEELLTTDVEVSFDAAEERVSARRRVSWDGLVLEESPAKLPSDEEAAAVLAAAAAEQFERVFPADDRDVANFVARVRSLASWMPELSLPMLDDAQLKSHLPNLCFGRRSFKELRSAPWLQFIKGLFTHVQLQTIEREAPERITVPTGNRISLTYEAGRPPVLAVRIQELFGLVQTPRVAGGRVPVLLHLLAPNMRPQQVTDDLASFWNNTYQQVRKDLRGRYPKHAWPEDPWNAQPQSRPKRKKA
jgi:ATP-dependent helicase HrpB